MSKVLQRSVLPGAPTLEELERIRWTIEHMPESRDVFTSRDIAGVFYGMDSEEVPVGKVRHVSSLIRWTGATRAGDRVWSENRTWWCVRNHKRWKHATLAQILQCGKV